MWFYIWFHVFGFTTTFNYKKKFRLFFYSSARIRTVITNNRVVKASRPPAAASRASARPTNAYFWSIKSTCRLQKFGNRLQNKKQKKIICVFFEENGKKNTKENDHF